MAVQPPASVVGIATAYGIISVFVVILNTWFVVLSLKERLWKKNKFFVLIGCLTFADAFVGITYIIFAVLMLLAKYTTALLVNFTSLDCYAALFPMVFGVVLQELITAVIALERFIAVRFPVAYYSHGDVATSITGGISVFLSFVIGVAGFGTTIRGITPNCTLETALVPEMGDFIQMLRFVLFFAGITLYAMLLVTMAWKARKTTAVRTGDDEARKKQARITRTVMILVILYVTTTGTSMGIAFAMDYGGFNPATQSFLGQISTLFNSLNCLLNVFVFPLKLDELREPIKAQLNVLCCGRISALTVTTTRIQKIGIGGASRSQGRSGSNQHMEMK